MFKVWYKIDTIRVIISIRKSAIYFEFLYFSGHIPLNTATKGNDLETASLCADITLSMWWTI